MRLRRTTCGHASFAPGQGPVRLPSRQNYQNSVYPTMTKQSSPAKKRCDGPGFCLTACPAFFRFPRRRARPGRGRRRCFRMLFPLIPEVLPYDGAKARKEWCSRLRCIGARSESSYGTQSIYFGTDTGSLDDTLLGERTWTARSCEAGTHPTGEGI